jgi:hypothetical protein
MMKTITDSASVAHALTVKKQALAAHAAEKLRRRLELEAAGATPVEASASDTPAGVMKRWLNGQGDDVVLDTADQELFQITVDQRGLADAIEYIDRRLFDAQATVAREWLDENIKTWKAVQLRRCRALLELRAVTLQPRNSGHRTRAGRGSSGVAGKKLAMVSVGPPTLPADRISGIFSHVQSGDFISKFLEDCRDAGIIGGEDIAR